MSELNTETTIKLLIEYLSVLSDGKIRPDTKGNHGNVRDAKDNIQDIEGVKSRIAELLNVKVDKNG